MIKENKAILKAVVITFIIVILLKISLVFLWPFLFSLILVLIMEPIVKYFISKGFKRNLSVIFTFTIFSMLILIFGAYIWSYIGERLVLFTDSIPKLIDSYKDFPILNTLNENYERILIELKNIIIEYKEKILTTIISTFNGFIYVFIVVLAAVFMSIDLDYLSRSLRFLLGDSIYRPIRKSLVNINILLSIEFKLVSITVIVTTISFMVLGFKDPLSIGIICGILDLLPIVGPLIIFLPIIIYLITVKQIFIAMGLIFTYILIIVLRQIVEIKLLQGNLVLKPIFVIFSLYCGVLLFGGLGVLLGPLVLIMFKEIYRSLEKGDLTHI
ncbi:AI-2E family transporter [Clostridium cylindrosporum]|uniref:Sporulation integral membrane protein YtvI n=1 Tax=Clostridium cylindrosporum DSM 605 TaxID=1121307 RepID=A0A0J8DB65_CLOCY|nr:AI-2E family transporter [Clostridium cylindrosporum]KMT23077.1 sporulation integral membrane protein YtvI [Clostridium cylindrosporum DSM 605]